MCQKNYKKSNNLQQTPNPAAQLPLAAPLLPEHSPLVKQVPTSPVTKKNDQKSFFNESEVKKGDN